MKLHPRSTALASLAIGLSLHTSSVRADVFDWNNITYAPSSTAAQSPISIGNSTNGGNSATVQFTLVGGATFAAGATNNTGSVGSYQWPISASYSQDNTYVSGGLADTQKALQIGANFSAAVATESIKVTVVFAKPVVSVNFNFFDVDTNASNATTFYNDQVSSIEGTLGNNTTAIIPTVGNNGSTTNTVSGNSATGTATNPQNSAGGNVSVDFTNAQAIDTLTFTYSSSYRGNNPATIQILGLSNISFANQVPEPGTTAMLAAGALGVGAMAFRRRRRA